MKLFLRKLQNEVDSRILNRELIIQDRYRWEWSNFTDVLKQIEGEWSKIFSSKILTTQMGPPLWKSDKYLNTVSKYSIQTKRSITKSVFIYLTTHFGGILHGTKQTMNYFEQFDSTMLMFYKCGPKLISTRRSTSFIAPEAVSFSLV